MKSAIACILFACLLFNAKAQSRGEGKLDVFTDGTNTAFRVVMPDPDSELRTFGGFSVGYHLLIDAGGEELATPLLLPEVDVPSPGMLTLSYVANRVWPEGTRFDCSLCDRDGNMLEAPPQVPFPQTAGEDKPQEDAISAAAEAAWDASRANADHFTCRFAATDTRLFGLESSYAHKANERKD